MAKKWVWSLKKESRDTKKWVEKPQNWSFMRDGQRDRLEKELARPTKVHLASLHHSLDRLAMWEGAVSAVHDQARRDPTWPAAGATPHGRPAHRRLPGRDRLLGGGRGTRTGPGVDLPISLRQDLRRPRRLPRVRVVSLQRLPRRVPGDPPHPARSRTCDARGEPPPPRFRPGQAPRSHPRGAGGRPARSGNPPLKKGSRRRDPRRNEVDHPTPRYPSRSCTTGPRPAIRHKSQDQ